LGAGSGCELVGGDEGGDAVAFGAPCEGKLRPSERCDDCAGEQVPIFYHPHPGDPCLMVNSHANQLEEVFDDRVLPRG
jgi:hypothetical protein